MPKIYKFSGYYIDCNNEYNEQNLQTILEEHLNLISQHIKVESADVGEWDDDSPLNQYDCKIEECERWFNNENTKH